jgi:hypothetical protein
VNVTTVTDWTAGLMTGLTAGLAHFFGAIPNILGALILLIIGWIVAGIVGGLVTRLCRGIHVDTVADRVGVNGFLQQSGTKLRASNILGEIIMWVIRLVFIEMAAEQLGMPQISLIINQILNQILGFIPNIIVAVVILGVGAFLGQLLGGIVRGAASEAKIGNGGLLSKLTFGAVIAFAIIAALNELNVAPVVVDTLYIGLVAALALALGLAFGLGGRRYCRAPNGAMGRPARGDRQQGPGVAADIARNRIGAFRDRARIADGAYNTRDLAVGSLGGASCASLRSRHHRLRAQLAVRSARQIRPSRCELAELSLDVLLRFRLLGVAEYLVGVAELH